MSLELKETIKDYQQRRKHLHLFDVNAWVGPQIGPHFRDLENADELLREMDRCDIENAVVTHTAALLSHTLNGNESLAIMLKNNKRLTGAYMLLPTTVREQGNSAVEILDSAIDKGFKMFRMFPKSMTFTLDDWCVGDLLGELNQRKLPLCIWHNETSWPEIGKICTTYPDLPVIIEGSGQKIIYVTRILPSILKQYKNLYVEVHGFFNFGLIEEFEKMALTEQLLFGTHIPFLDPHVAVGMISYANIAESNAAKIAGDNLRKILKGAEQ